jgi:hypothetical protein
MPLVYVAFAILISLLVWRTGWTAPATVFVAYFLALILAGDLLPIGLFPVGLQARWTILVGLAGFAAPALIAGSKTTSRAGNMDVADPEAGRVRGPGPPARMYAWTASLVLLTFVGFTQTPHVGIGNLNFIDVRQAAVDQDTSQQGPGLLPLLVALAPLVAGLGVIGAIRYRRYSWLLLVVFALAVTLPTPAKTYTLAVVFISIVFYVLCRQPRQRSRVRHRIPMFALGAVSLMAAVVYFVALDTALNKDISLDQGLSHSWVPSALLGPTVYELGGFSALSVAQAANIDPRVDSYGRSVYAIPWALRFVDSSFHKPQTIAYDITIPVPINVYTGFGDLWFDFGWVGLFFISGVLGIAVTLAHRRWRPTAYHWGMVLAILIQVLATMTLAFRLFYLETILQLAVGYVAFRHIAADAAQPARYTSNARNTAKPVQSPQLSY